MSKNEIAHKGKLDRDDLTSLLEGMARGFETGTVCIHKGSEHLTLRPGGVMDFEIEAEIKKDKQRLVLELEWEYDADSVHSDDHFGICSAEPKVGIGVVTAHPYRGEGAIGVTGDEGNILRDAWSIQKDILNKDVYNEANEKVGVVEDIIVTPDKAMSYSIVSTGGFLGIAKHDVAVLVSNFKIKDKHIILPGATKEAVKGMPEFKYADLPLHHGAHNRATPVTQR